MVSDSWWVEGLYSNELEAGEAPPDPAIAKAWISVLSGATTEAEFAQVCAVLGLKPAALLSLSATPPHKRVPRAKTRPDWAVPLPAISQDILQLPVWKSWSKKSATAGLILPVLTEVYTALAPSFARMSKASGLGSLADGVLDKLLYVLDYNICALSEADSKAPLQDPYEFWASKPAALRHARAVSGAFIATILAFETALRAAPDYINLGALTHLFIEPLDLHRGGSSVVMAEGAGVFQPRETVAFDLLQQLFEAARGEGMLRTWCIPRYHGIATGTWVEWIEGTDLDDMDADKLAALAPDLAAFAVLMWVFGAAGIEPESIMAPHNADQIFVVQADGLFAPTLGKVDEKAQLQSWLELFFANSDLPICPRFTDACKAQAMAALEVAQKIAPALLKKAESAGQTRCFIRPVSAYSQLLRAVPHINAAGDGLARELVFSRLRAVPESFAGLDLLPVIQEELSDLKRYDLPFVSTRPAGKTLFFDSHRALSNRVPDTAIDQIEARLEICSEMAQTIKDFQTQVR